MFCCSKSPHPSLRFFLLYFPAFLAGRSSKKSNWSLCQGQYSAVWGEWCFELGSIVFSSGAAQTRSRARAHFTHRASGKPEVPWMCQPCATNPGGISHELFTVQLSSFKCRSWLMPAPGCSLSVGRDNLSPSQTQLEKNLIPTPDLLIWWPNCSRWQGGISAPA